MSLVAMLAELAKDLEAEIVRLRAEVDRLKVAYDDHVVRLTEDVVRLMAERDRLKEQLVRIEKARDEFWRQRDAEREEHAVTLKDATQEIDAGTLALTREAAVAWLVEHEEYHPCQGTGIPDCPACDFKAAHPELFKRAGPDPGVAPSPREPGKAPERPVDASGG